MDLQFTLSELEETYQEAQEYYNEYRESIDTINKIIEELSESWISQETNTYQTFLSLYKEKYPKMIELQNTMYMFCKKLEDKKDSLKDMSISINKSFE